MLHKEHMEYFLLGCFSTIPFDSYELEKESYLYEEAYLQLLESEIDDQLSF
jgi:hypothetical protein